MELVAGAPTAVPTNVAALARLLAYARGLVWSGTWRGPSGASESWR